MKITPSQQRLGAIVALILFGAYVLLSLLIVSPPSPVRTALSGVTSAASPYFSQKWNVFAPNIMKWDSTMRIQAQWRDDSGKLVTSDWFNLTLIEGGAVTGSLAPSRVQKSSWNAILAYHGRYLELNEEQRAVVRDTFIEKTKDGFGAKPAEELIDELTALGESRGDVIRLLRYDNSMRQLATNAATAYFDESIVRVRWEHSRTRANDFTHRFQDEQQFAPLAETYGWRQAKTVDPAAVEVYREVFSRYGGTK